jgi:transposase InsO family protein
LKRLARVVKTLESLRVQALVAKATIVRFDVCIVNEFAGTYEIHIDSPIRGTKSDDVDLEKELAEWERFYNYDRPHGAHHGGTPYEAPREKLQ